MLRRFWIWFWCRHLNTQKLWSDGDGWYILACSKCGRTVIFTDGDFDNNPNKVKLP